MKKIIIAATVATVLFTASFAQARQAYRQAGKNAKATAGRSIKKQENIEAKKVSKIKVSKADKKSKQG